MNEVTANCWAKHRHQLRILLDQQMRQLAGEHQHDPADHLLLGSAGTEPQRPALDRPNRRHARRGLALIQISAAERRLPKEDLDRMSYMAHPYCAARRAGHREFAFPSAGPQGDHAISTVDGDYSVAPVSFGRCSSNSMTAS